MGALITVDKYLDAEIKKRNRKRYLENIDLMRFARLPLTILPRGTRFYKQAGEEEVFVIEEAPTVRTVTWKYATFDKDDEDADEIYEVDRFSLAFPYVVFIYANCKMSIFFRNKPLKSLDDILYHSILPNVEDQDEICLGRYEVWWLTQKGNDVEHAIKFFWNSPFDEEELDELWYDAKDLYRWFCNVKSWSKASLRNPNFPLKVKWREAGTLKENLDEMGNCDDVDEDLEFDDFGDIITGL